MLHYMGTRQRPRKYTACDNQKATSPPIDPCRLCLSHVWTRELFAKLKNLSADEEKCSASYRIAALDLRHSVLSGCKFCRTLADGIHGRVFLDELYARIESVEDSDGGASSDEFHEYVEEEDDDDDDEHAQAEDDDGWNDASAFNEDEISDDITGGWDAWEDRDTLSEFFAFDVTLTFVRGENSLFSFVNACIEAAADPGEDTKSQKLQGDDAVDLRYHLNSNGNDINLPISTLDSSGVAKEADAALFPIRMLDGPLGSELNMQTIEKWMQGIFDIRNDSTAESCQVPARLIDVSAKDDLRIIQTSRMSQSNTGFAALSYVWGTKQNFVLLGENREALMSSFQMNQLPKTIQDVITVTRRLGLRYLWVDALCIVQDSNEDKARELPKMRLIYKHAAVTILASVARSAEEGFLHYIEEKSFFIEPLLVPSRIETQRGSQSYVMLSYPADYKRWKDPINDRAWTFQELLLSTRTIVFSYRGLQFIDRTNRPLADGMTSGKDPQLPGLPWSGQLFSLTTAPENARQVWLAVRGEYTRRHLTYQSDKLLAIAAVAEEIGRTYGSEYIAGMWKRDLAMDLQWSCLRVENVTDETGRKARAKEYVAPSWSWASVDAVVDDYTQVFEGEGAFDGRGLKTSLGFEVVSCSVELAVPDFPWGAVRSGELVVLGHIYSCIWRPHQNTNFSVRDESDGFLFSKPDDIDPPDPPRKIGQALLDALDAELEEDVEAVCLATRLIENQRGRDEIEGLMLLPVDEEHYRRVGFFKTYPPSIYEGLERAVIKII